jgi:hypothetical protein
VNVGNDFVELVSVDAVWSMRESDRRVSGNRRMDDVSWSKFKNDIFDRGVVKPIVVGYFEVSGVAVLVDGHHRLAAAKELGLKYVPAIGIRYDAAYKGDRSLGVKVRSRIGWFPLPTWNIKPSDLGIPAAGPWSRK